MINEVTDRYLIFKVDEEYAIHLSEVVKIIEYQPVTAIPEVPEYIAGVINMYGQVVPVIDVRARLKKSPAPRTDRACIVIVEIDGIRLGLIVDEVLDLITIDEGNIRQAPQFGSIDTNTFVKAVGVVDSKMKLILDANKLITYSDLGRIDEMSQ